MNMVISGICYNNGKLTGQKKEIYDIFPQLKIMFSLNLKIDNFQSLVNKWTCFKQRVGVSLNTQQ